MKEEKPKPQNVALAILGALKELSGVIAIGGISGVIAIGGIAQGARGLLSKAGREQAG